MFPLSFPRISGIFTYISLCKAPNCEVHTTEVVCFLWREAQPLSLTLRSHARMSTCYERQPGTTLLRPQKPATHKQRGRYVMPNAPKSEDLGTPQISEKIRSNEKPTADQWVNELKERPMSEPLRASHSPQTN